MSISTFFFLGRVYVGFGREEWFGGKGAKGCCSVPADGAPTSALAIRPPKNSALLDLTEGGEHHPDLVLAVLLGDHAYEELPVFHRCRASTVKGERYESASSCSILERNNHSSHENRC